MKMVGSCFGRFGFLEDSVLNKLFTAGMMRGKMPFIPHKSVSIIGAKKWAPPLPKNSDAKSLPAIQTHSEFLGEGVGG